MDFKKDAFAQLHERLAGIEQTILQTKKALTFKEAARYTGIAPSTLYKLTSANKVPFYKPNGKTIYFDRQELENWLLQNRQATHIELDTKAATYISTHQALGGAAL